MLSSTYQQASFDRPDVPPGRPREPAALAVQPPPARPRGDARHAALRLGPARRDRWEAGRSTWPSDPKTARRTVYGLVDRQSLPAVFRAFDFASPDQSAERRPRTTVPQQALFSMNSPFVIEQARALAARPERLGGTTAEARIAALYRRVLARPPDPVERPGGPPVPGQRLDVEPDRPGDRSQLTAWEQLAQVLLMTNELMFVD